MITDQLQTINAIDKRGTKEAEDQVLPYIRDKLREGMFTDMIVPPRKVTRAELQVSTEHDTLVKIEEVEPGGRAMPISFRGMPDAEYMSGSRFAVAFWTISSLMFEITENDLMAYTMELPKIVEQNSIKDMGEVKDLQFILHNDTAIEAMQTEANGGATAFNTTNVNANAVYGVSKVKGSLALARATDDFVAQPIQKVDVIAVKKLLTQQIEDSSGNEIRHGRLRPETILLTEADMYDTSAWTMEQVGTKIVEETTVNGYVYQTLCGLKIVKTLKHNIVREGNAYVFTSPDFYGRNYNLHDIKFWMEKKANRLYWQAWMDIGMAIANIASVVKLELYSGSTTPDATDVGYAAKVPVTVANLSGRNNKVDEGLTFPSISQF